MSNGEGIEREADATVHPQHLHLVLSIKGDILPTAVQRQVLGDSQGLRQGNISTTAQCDGITTTGTGDGGIQMALVTGAETVVVAALWA